MPIDWQKVAEAIGIIGAGLQDAGAGVGGRQGGNIAALNERKRKKQLAAQNAQFGQQLSSAILPQQQGQSFPSPSGPGDPSPQMGAIMRQPTMQDLAPLFAQAAGQGVDTAPWERIARMMQSPAPEEFTLGEGQTRYRGGQPIAQGMPKPSEGFTLGEGQQRFDAMGRPLASGPARQANPNQPFLPDGTPNLAYQDYQTRLRREGKPETNVTVGAERAFEQEKGKGQGARLNAMIEGADLSRKKIDMLVTLSAKLGDTPFAGPMADILTDATMLAGQLGLSATDTSSAEIVRSFTNQLALMLRNPKGDGGLTGNTSNSDREFLVQSIPGLRNSRGGAKAMADIAVKLERRNMEIAELAEEYADKYGSLTGFVRFKKEWAETNPLFTDQTQQPQQPGAANVIDFNDLPGGR